MSFRPSGEPSANKGVALTNWMVQRASGFLERRSSRRGFLVGSAVAGSAVAVAGIDLATKPMSAYAAITDCGPGSACADGYTEFCCGVTGVNACPTGSFAGGWWRADYSSFCNGTRYYIDCMQDCCGPGVGGNFCAGCTECRCANGCGTRRVYCNYFRYGQCHQEIQFSGPIACRIVTCVPPYTVAEWACSTAAAVDNATAEHAGNCLPPPPPPLPPARAVLPAFGAAAVHAPGDATVFVRTPAAAVAHLSWTGTTFGPWSSFGPTINSGLTTIEDATGTYVFGRGNDLALWYRRRVGDEWSPWTRFGGVCTSDPSAAVDPAAGSYVFVRGVDNGVYYRRVPDGVDWVPLGPTAESEPVAVSHSSGLYVFVTGVDTGVWYRRLTGGSWSPWLTLGPTASSTISATAGALGLFVFMRGKDNAVWYRRLTGSSWSAWTSLGPTATSDPVAVTDSTGVYVFMRGVDNGVWYRRFDGSSWTPWAGLGPAIVTDPMPVSDGTSLFVFGQGVDAGVWYRRLASGTWSPWATLGAPMQAVRA